MSSYIFFLQVYKKYSTFRIARSIYKGGGRFVKIGFWLGWLLILSCLPQYLFTQKVAQPLLQMSIGGVIWVGSFLIARRRYLAAQPSLSDEKDKIFGSNYQYIRYHLFLSEVKSQNRQNEAERALAFLNNLMETEHSISIGSHWVIGLLIGTVLALVGGSVAEWDHKYLYGTILVSFVAIYLASMFLSLWTPKEAKVKELKRFLFWMVHDKAEEPVPAVQPEPIGQQEATLSLVQKNNGVVSPDPGIAAKTETPQENAA